MAPSANQLVPEYLQQARLLAERRDWPELARLAEEDTTLMASRPPEFGYLVADALRRTGRAKEARGLATAIEAAAIRSGDRRFALRTINLLGMIEFEGGAVAEAETRFNELLNLAAEWGDDEFVARASNNLGVIANLRAERELALTSYQRAVAAYYRIGYARGLAQTHYNLGISYRDLAFPDDAERHYTSAIRYAEISGSEDVVALAETERALLRALAGDGRLAASLALRALHRLDTLQDPSGRANAIRVLALAAQAEGDSTAALQHFAAALAILDLHPDLLIRAEIHRDRGRLLARTGDLQGALLDLALARDSFAILGAAAEVVATREMLDALDAREDPQG